MRPEQAHTQQWSRHSVFKMAFARDCRARSLPSNRYIEARAAVVAASLSSQQESARRRFAEEGCSAVYIERSFDDTPVHIEFGQLAEELAPVARFLVPPNLRQAAGAALASWSEACGLNLPKRAHGIVDVVVQTVTCANNPGSCFEMSMPPRVMTGKTVAHIVAATESALDGGWSIDSVAGLRNNIRRLVLLVDLADSAKSNRKAMEYVGSKLKGVDGVMYFAQRCSVHQLIRGVVRVLERFKVIQSLFPP